ncbi:MAG TPA: hypothetical protein VFQ82_12940 [Stellaceae bacterium]|jgi:putative MFS transporter|nr:hypothetical protein [Stellaceae bacterium]
MPAVAFAGCQSRLFITGFFWLIAAGMFFDGYDLYIAVPVLSAALHVKFSSLSENGWFLSLTFVGMTTGSLPRCYRGST